MVLTAGTRVRDYEIIRLLGEGGMGEVYLAKDSVLDRMVALKRIKNTETQDAQFSQRFLNEARIQARLSNPHIVALYACFEESGTYYIAMEYAAGITLDQLIKHIGPIPEDRALRIFRQIATALDHAHSQGVIHRDVKPSNIIVDVEHGDKVKVSDFGIARMMLEGHITRTGTQMGSPYYMSPEQVLAEKDVDHRSDIFSAGIVLYEMLTGKLPYFLDTDSLYKIHDQILRAPLPDPRAYYEYISERSIALVNRLTAKDRNSRPQTLAMALTEPGMAEGSSSHQYIPPGSKTPVKPIPRLDKAPQSAMISQGQQNQSGAGSPRPALHMDNQPDQPPSQPPRSNRRWLLPVSIALFLALAAFVVYTKFIAPGPENPDGLKGDVSWMVRVEGGTYMMGSEYGDKDEKPVHQVTITPFYISPYELTQKEWVQYMPTNPSTFRGDNHPVEGISWYDAVRYCNLRSEAEGLTPCYSGSGDGIVCDWSADGYRLPTEAEWEYAARGGANILQRLFSGSDAVDEVAWYKENSGGSTHPIGTKASNNLNLYDMSGNVYEWCWDRWIKAYDPNWTSVNPKGTEKGIYRIARGGAWDLDAYNARITFRSNYKPETTLNNKGLRLVRSIP